MMMIVSGYIMMNFFTVAYVSRFSILDSSTHKSELIQCAGDVVVFSCEKTFFLLLVLDKVVCPFLPVVKYFEIMMPIWHPTSEKALDELLDAKVDV